MLSYAIYDDKKIKTKFPNSTVCVDGIKPITGIDYICFGFYMDDSFITKFIRPLYQMKFAVKKIISCNELNNYCYLSVNIIEYQHGREIPHIQNVIVEGLFFNVYPDAEFEAIGYWKENFKGRETFVLTEHTEILKSTTVSVFNFLKHVLKGKRVSEKIIKAIVNKYDIKSIEAIKTMDPGLFTITKSISKWTTIQDCIVSNFEQEQAFKYLLEYNISSYVAVKVLEKYQKMAMIQIKKNPYCLLSFSDIDFKIIDKMAIKEGIAHNDANRIEACILYYIQSQVNQNGDIYVDKNELIGPVSTKRAPLNKFIKKIGLYKEPLLNSDILPILTTMESLGTIIIEQNLKSTSKQCVYKSYYNMIENQIVFKLKNINTSLATHFVPSTEIENFLNDLENSSIKLDILQKDAVYMALQNRLSILTGGPGTGKTQTIKIIVDALLKNNPTANIQLCAPTGKASRRMSEVIGKPAETIHKKLNYMPFSGGGQDLEPIDCDLLIIDETSMLDIDLFYKLLKNISDTTNILLVGDYNQLPSVGPGLILRDIIDSNVIPVVQLKKVFRQSKDNDIIDVSQSILNNDSDAILKKPIRKFFKFKEMNLNDEIMNEILAMTNEILKRKIPILEFQIITPMNDGLLGTLGINKKVQDLINPPAPGKNEILVSALKIFREGDKVIQTQNNYDLHVFNGSIGTIIEIDNSKRTLTVDYDGDEIEYKAENISELNLAYAITVHKSQGSEFDFVIMPVTSNHLSINNRNLMYTALTRAKRQILFVGEASALKESIEKVETIHKKSQIKEKLLL